jgi:hypothetical protein
MHSQEFPYGILFHCQGETTTFSPGLKIRIVKWLQNNNVEKEEPADISSDLQSTFVKSHPPRLRTKGSLVVLKDEKAANDEKMIDPHIAVASSLTEDLKKGDITKVLSTTDPTSMKEVLSELVRLYFSLSILSTLVKA